MTATLSNHRKLGLLWLPLCVLAGGAAAMANDNICPVSSGFPPGNVVNITTPGAFFLTVSFDSPESDQVTNVVIEDPDNAQGAGLTIDVFPGQTAYVDLDWSPDCLDEGTYVLTFQATDDYVPPCTTTEVLTIIVDCPNTPPFCDAGGPYYETCDGPTVQIQLDNYSYDNDPGDWITYSWSTDCPGGSFNNPSAEFPTLTVDAECYATCTVYLTVTDSEGATDSCDAEVTVEDDWAPNFTFSPESVTFECDGEGNMDDIQPWLDSASAWDDCQGNVMVTNDFSGLSGGCGQSGYADVTWYADDGCGNVNNHYATVTVEDTTDPVIDTYPSDLTVECGEDAWSQFDAWVNDHGGAEAHDLCGDVTWYYDNPPLSDECGETGSTMVTFTVEDECSNWTQTTAMFTIEDTTPPTIDWPTQNNVTVECDGAGNVDEYDAWRDSLGAATAHDDCGDVELSDEFSELSDGCGATGVATQTWTATDDCGLVSTATATFTIEDTTPPTITCDATGGVVDENCEFQVTFSGTVTDTCGVDPDDVDVTLSVATGNATLSSEQITILPVSDTEVSVSGSVLVSDLTGCPATVEVRIEAEDECGNPGTPCVAPADVTDDTQPVGALFSSAGLVDENCESVIEFSGSVSDNCCVDPNDVDVTVTLLTGNATLAAPTIDKTQVSPGEVSFTGSVLVSDLTSCPATVEISLEADDCCGNAGVPLFVAPDVTDVTPPAITCDAVGGVVDENCEFTVTYEATVTDNCCVNRDDVRVDVTLLTGNATLAAPTINKTQVSPNEVSVTGSVLVSDLTSCPATIELRVDADDCCDNPAETCVATADVVDETQPELTCSATGGVVDENCEYLLPFDATITDNCCVDRDDVRVDVTLLTGNATLGVPTINKTQVSPDEVSVTGSVLVSDLTSCPATVEVRVEADDCCENAGEPCVATADVTDDIPPELTCPPDAFFEHGSFFCNEGEVLEWLESATATDNCDPNVTIVNDAPACGFPPDSSTLVTWTATDDCGNTDECSATVTIPPLDRGEVGIKGSLLVYPNVEVRWDAGGNLIQDTFLSLGNDFPEDVWVVAYLVSETCVSRNNNFVLTHNEPAYWSAATGLPKGLSPWAAVAAPYADPEGSGELIARGFVVLWAINSAHEEIRWNHLHGQATIVNYADNAAWEYLPWAFRTDCVEHGEEPLDCLEFDPNGACCVAEAVPGNLDFDGFQYDITPARLLLNFIASGAQAYSIPGNPVVHDTDLTLLLMDQDLRQETVGPFTTKASFAVWNENEVSFSGAHACIVKWDQMLFSTLGGHFLRQNLQTDAGRTRIDGVGSALCLDSADAALIGVANRLLDVGLARALSGSTLQISGREAAHLQADIPDPPEEKSLQTPESGGLQLDMLRPAESPRP